MFKPAKIDETKPFRSGAEYKDHFRFTPVDDDQIVWRYLDFYKFKSLIEERALYFTNILSFIDKKEGTYPLKNYNQYHVLIPDYDNDRLNVHRDLLKKAKGTLAKYIYVTCFTIRDEENERMWREYTNKSESVALRTTFSRLKQSIVSNRNDNGLFTEVYGGKVRYLDYGTEEFADLSVLAPFLHKDESFRYEQELRLITTYPYVDRVLDGCSPEVLKDSGKTCYTEYVALPILPKFPAVKISVDLDALIEGIVVHPNASTDFYEEVKGIVRENNLKCTISRSKLGQIS